MAELNHYHLKNAVAAERAYKQILLFSSPGDDMVAILKAKSDLEMNLMQRPDLAITTLEKISLLPTKKEEKIKNLLQLAKMYQDRRLWEEAKMTIQQVLDLNPAENEKFLVQLSKAALLNQTKKFEEEVRVYEELLQKNPDLSRKNKTVLQLLLSYEQRKLWKEALQALQKWKDLLPEEMVREKELELKKRIYNEPGSRGLRK